MKIIKNFLLIRVLSKPAILIMVFSFMVVLAFSFLVVLPQASALDLTTQLKGAGGAAYGVTGEPQSPAVIVGNIIQILLAFLGTIALILVLYGGFLWMTAAGSEEKVKKAKELLKNATIGLVIIVAAYSITYFVIEQVGKATGVEGGAGGTKVKPGGG